MVATKKKTLTKESTRPFVHLHCHSHYSLLDGASRLPELCAAVKGHGMNSVALTDHGNLYGAIDFYSECKSAGLNPVIGYEAYVAPNKRTDREAKKRGEAGFHLTILAQNNIGFKNLIKLSTIAYLEGFYYIPRIDKEVLEAHSEGLIVLSGCASSEFSDHILKEDFPAAEKLAAWFAKVFKKRFFVEVQNNGLDIQRECAQGAIRIADAMGLPLVATSDAHYLTKDDALAHDVLLCVNTGRKLDDPNRMRYGSDLFYVRPPEEMYDLFPGQDASVKRSQEIADTVDINLDFTKRHFPVYTAPVGVSAEDHLREMCAAGLKKRFGDNPSTTVTDRLNHELGIICRMGFASYFLIVGDFVRFAMDNGIPSSARGSACGALVSYVLELSHVDPLEYDLLFERFLDPNRSEAPDIDIDFCQNRREEVLAYVRQKYGEASVAQIGTFGTMAARAAIKDVGRALDVPLEKVNQLVSFIPKTLGITLPEALAESRDLKMAYDGDPEIKRLLDIAIKLEGTNRNTGTHAAGVVISDGPLVDYAPLQRVVRKGDDAGSGDAPITTTQWTMEDLEKVGLLKMDFLGLRTLTVLDNAVRIIRENRGIEIDLKKIPLDDKLTFALLQRGDAKGVFQLESDGIRELLKRLKPDNIRDIIAIMALYRPGPLEGGMVDSFVNRKHGTEKPHYAHPFMEEILSETHGVMVYQEQIMRILNRLGGIELSSAYACIKAISKKKHDIIDQRKGEFIQGGIERGLAREVAEEIFQLIVVFGGYGFNKSHSAAYAQIGYQTAWLKAHYLPEFMAALLTSEIDDANKRDILVDHIADSRRLGVDVIPPSVNLSQADFIVHKGKIIFGLLAIKGVGRQAALEIARARQEGGNFKDLFDLCEHIDGRLVPKSALEKMVYAGAMDCFKGHRAQFFAALPRAVQAAQLKFKDQKAG
ncbi:MAG: DNA polymerase III subunit alpha, partial [Planctomycetota bacterium]